MPQFRGMDAMMVKHVQDLVADVVDGAFDPGGRLGKRVNAFTGKPGKAFLFASAEVFMWIILEIVATYTVPFFRDVLDRPDPACMSDKALFTLGGFALLAAGTAWSVQASVRRFESVDLSL